MLSCDCSCMISTGVYPTQDCWSGCIGLLRHARAGDPDGGCDLDLGIVAWVKSGVVHDRDRRILPGHHQLIRQVQIGFFAPKGG